MRYQMNLINVTVVDWDEIIMNYSQGECRLHINIINILLALAFATVLIHLLRWLYNFQVLNFSWSNFFGPRSSSLDILQN